MIRIITWRANGTAPADTAPGAPIAAFNELSAAVDKVRKALTPEDIRLLDIASNLR